MRRMGGADQDKGELERLLGEIPNDTSGIRSPPVNSKQHVKRKDMSFSHIQSVASAFTQLRVNEVANGNPNSSFLNSKDLEIFPPLASPNSTLNGMNLLSLSPNGNSLKQQNAVPVYPVPGAPVSSYLRSYYSLGNSQELSASNIWMYEYPTMRPLTNSIDQPRFEMPIIDDACVPRFNASEVAITGCGVRGCHCFAQGLNDNEESGPFGHDQRQISLSTFSTRSSLTNDFEAVQVFDRMKRDTFPERTLTRSNGLNPLRAINPSSIRVNEVLNRLNIDGKMLNDRNLSRSQEHEYSKLQLHKYESVDEVIGRIYRLAKDHKGCHFLQEKLVEGNPEDIRKIFLEIIDNIVELMLDPFGNYLVQRLLEVCNETQRMHILRAITKRPGELVRISSDTYGTRAVQKVIETLKTREQSAVVVSSLKPGIIRLMKDLNGTHVAQRCLQYLIREHIEILFEAMTPRYFELSTDRQGCVVLQKCLLISNFKQKHQLIHKIISNAFILAQDPFGNYVVQCVLELQIPWATTIVLNQFEGCYLSLSLQKISSHVVEKCLIYGGEDRRSQIIKELLSGSCFDQILLHPFGNYVVQSALNTSKGAVRAAVVNAMTPHIPTIKTLMFCKKLLECYNQKK